MRELGVPAPMALAVDAARVKSAGSSWQSLLDLMPFVVTLGAMKKATKAASSCGGCAQLVSQVIKAELTRRGVAVNNHLCEHFAYSRQELFHLAKIGRVQTFEDLVAQRPDESLLVERLSEEHATVRVLGAESGLRIGDLVRVLPNHSCVVSNLVDAVWLVNGDAVLDELPVAARGRIT